MMRSGSDESKDQTNELITQITNLGNYHRYADKTDAKEILQTKLSKNEIMYVILPTPDKSEFCLAYTLEIRRTPATDMMRHRMVRMPGQTGFIKGNSSEVEPGTIFFKEFKCTSEGLHLKDNEKGYSSGNVYPNFMSLIKAINLDLWTEIQLREPLRETLTSSSLSSTSSSSESHYVNQIRSFRAYRPCDRVEVEHLLKTMYKRTPTGVDPIVVRPSSEEGKFVVSCAGVIIQTSQDSKIISSEVADFNHHLVEICPNGFCTDGIDKTFQSIESLIAEIRLDSPLKIEKVELLTPPKSEVSSSLSSVSSSSPTLFATSSKTSEKTEPTMTSTSESKLEKKG